MQLPAFRRGVQLRHSLLRVNENFEFLQLFSSPAFSRCRFCSPSFRRGAQTRHSLSLVNENFEFLQLFSSPAFLRCRFCSPSSWRGAETSKAISDDKRNCGNISTPPWRPMLFANRYVLFRSHLTRSLYPGIVSGKGLAGDRAFRLHLAIAPTASAETSTTMSMISCPVSLIAAFPVFHSCGGTRNARVFSERSIGLSIPRSSAPHEPRRAHHDIGKWLPNGTRSPEPLRGRCILHSRDCST